MIENLIMAALALSLLGALTFAFVYTFRANWRTTPLGRHMFYFSWAFVLALLTNLLRIWVKDMAVDVIRVSSLFILAAVYWQRVYLLVRSLRRSHD